MSELLKQSPRFEIKANVLYSREALQAELGGLIDVDTFLLRVHPKKIFKSCFWGRDLIEGLDNARPLGDEVYSSDVAAEIGWVGRGGKRANGKRYPAGLRPIGQC